MNLIAFRKIRIGLLNKVGFSRFGFTVIFSLLLTLSCSQGILAQDTISKTLEEVVVSATRKETDKKQLPESVTVIDQEQIRNEMSISSDLGEIIGKHVPGVSPANQSMSNFGQTMRGRKFLTLIDGVPQSTPMRDGARDLQNIDPSSIERIEVVRGGTSIYGYNAAGGAINIITKDVGKDKVEQFSELQFGGSEHNLSGSLNSRLLHQLRGAKGDYQFIVSGMYGVTNSFFDGHGDRIPSDPRGQGGLAESDRYQLSGKLKRTLSSEQAIELNIQSFRHHQERDYLRVAGDVSNNQKTTAQEGEPTVVKDPGNENDVIQLSHTDENLYGFESTTKFYFQDNLVRYDTTPFFGNQTLIESEKVGGRLTLNGGVTLPNKTEAELIWGLDYLKDETQQRSVEGPIITPLMEQTSWAPFAQLEVPMGQNLLVRGGVRHEELTMDIPTFTQHPDFGGNTITGGALSYSETVGNLGLVWYLTDATDVRASFSQGFSVTDIGRTLRSTTASSVEAVDPGAQVVDSYELGIGTNWSTIDYDLTTFYNESELGTTYAFSGGDLKIQRQPEKIWGIEGSLNYDPSGPYKSGINGSWQEGKQDSDDDGTYESYLPGTRISPIKFSGYLEYAAGQRLVHRFQSQYWGNRDRFDGSAAYAEGDVNSEILFDYLATYDLDRGQFKFGINNLLDDFYFPVQSQVRNLDSSYTAGRGRSFQFTYQYHW